MGKVQRAFTNSNRWQ